MKLEPVPTGDKKLMQEHFDAKLRDLVAEHLQAIADRYALRGRRITQHFIEGRIDDEKP
jgi:hypothetical protein